LVIDRAGERLDSLLPGRQGRLLGAYLILTRHRPTPRAELIDAIWPERRPGNADSGLSALLSKLRQALGVSAIEGRGSLRFAATDPWVDLEVAREAVHRAESSVAVHDWTRAWAPAQIALFAAERGLLTGEDGDEEFAWLRDERRHLADLRLRALETYAAACLGIGGGELAAAVRSGRTLMQEAPYRETGYQLLMHALAAQGNRAEALHAYHQLRVLLRDELGTTPSQATQDVFAELNT
jgi:DNA-binding SARP family transcriptional activator